MSAPLHGSDGTRAPLRTAPHTDPDHALLLRIKEGEADAFTPLWKKYEPSLFRLFFQGTGDRQDAEDLTTEALAAAYSGIPTFRGFAEDPETGTATSCTFDTYLQAIARNMLKRWIQRKGRREARLNDLLPEGSEGMDDAGDLVDTLAFNPDGLSSDPLVGMLDSERTDQTCFAVANIPSSTQFKAMLLHYGAGMKHQEIAALLDTRSETVSNRLQDGRKALKRQFDRMDQTFGDTEESAGG